MARWEEVEVAAPEFAARVRARFDAHRHKRLATSRNEGSPRSSGIEAAFAEGGVWLGMVWRPATAHAVSPGPSAAPTPTGPTPEPLGERGCRAGRLAETGAAISAPSRAVRATGNGRV